MKRRASIPGRINIIGEHTDYAGGCSLAFASQHRLVLEAEFVDDGYHGDSTVVALWKEAGGPPAKLEVTSLIPTGKGMSSSAALCLSIVLCVHGGSIDKQAACEEAQRLEHVVLGTPCGLLDQMTMMHSLEGECVLIDFSTKTTTTMYGTNLKSTGWRRFFERETGRDWLDRKRVKTCTLGRSREGKREGTIGIEGKRRHSRCLGTRTGSFGSSGKRAEGIPIIVFREASGCSCRVRGD